MQYDRMLHDPLKYEPALSDFNIEHFGGAPPDDGDIYMAEDVMQGFEMRVGELIVEASTCGRSHEVRTLAEHLAASSPEKGIRGARLVAAMWEAHLWGNKRDQRKSST